MAAVTPAVPVIRCAKYLPLRQIDVATRIPAAHGILRSGCARAQRKPEAQLSAGARRTSLRVRTRHRFGMSPYGRIRHLDARRPAVPASRGA